MQKLVKIKSFNDQLNKLFLARLMVAGLLVVFIAVCLHFLSLSFYEKYVLDNVGDELTQLVAQMDILEKAFNDQLKREAMEEADAIYQRIVNGDGQVETSVLYRVITSDDQVTHSNHDLNLPKPFKPIEWLYKAKEGSPEAFDQAYLNQLHASLEQEASVVYPVEVLDPNGTGDFVFYKVYTDQVVVEIFMSQFVKKEQLRSFFLQRLDALFQSEKLEDLLLYDAEGTQYSKGILVNHIASDDSESEHLHGNMTLSYGGQPLFLSYSIGNAASDVIKFRYVLWVILFYGLATIIMFFLLKRGSKAVLDPINLFLKSANDAKLGYYEKRQDFLDTLGFRPLNLGFNAMLDHMESLLEEKKVHEDRLRALYLEEQQEGVENVGLDEALCAEIRLKQAVGQASNVYTQLIMTLCSAIEAKDQYTSGHCERVLTWSVKLAECCGITGSDLEDVKLGALLHDVGKLGLPEELLNKLEPLTDYEWSVLKRHSRFGEEILADFNVSDQTKKIVAMHHEHYDGKGYPKGDKGQEIPLGARIVCLIDAYDAMSNPRPYRLTPLGKADIIKELNLQSAKQFDPELVDLLIQVIGDEGGVADEL